MVPRSLLMIFTAAAVGIATTSARADDALHVRIDSMIEEASFGAVAPVASDGEFLRRLYLDLTGSIPPADVARSFLDDESADKRTKIIDRLLNSPQHVRHLTNVIDVMLMERRAEKHVKNDEWRKYLYDSIAANKPWNQLAKEILAADGTDEKIRHATAFYFVRDAEPNLLTRDVGRMFFGLDLQCAQCHNHPLIDSYAQSDYYGIYAFLSRGFIFTAKDKKVFYAEKAEGDVSFTSVFTDEQDKTFPRLPGAFEIDEPFLPKGEEYKVAPAKDVRPVPKYSRRSKLAELVDGGTNRQFNRNIANRLWALMLGRGLVEPVDLHHADNPPAHPELLELIADQFAMMKYDVKAFLRELALTKTYQRSLDSPANLAELAGKLKPQLEQLNAESVAATEAVANARAAITKLNEQIAAADKAADPIYEELSKANNAIGEARKKSDAATKALTDAKNQLTAKQAIAMPLTEASVNATKAAELLPADKEVAALAQKLKARADKITAEVAAANKVVEEKTPPATAAAEALAAAKQGAMEVKKRFDDARAKVRELEAQVIPATSGHLVARTNELRAKSRVATAGLAIDYSRLSASQAALDTSFQQQNTELAAARKTMQAVEAELAKMKKAFATAKQGADSATAAHQAAAQQHSTIQEVAALTSQAAASAANAASQLPDDKELKTILTSLTNRNNQLKTQVADLEKLVAQKQAEAKVAVESMAKLKTTTDAKAAEFAAIQTKVSPLAKANDELNGKAEAGRSELNRVTDELVSNWETRFFTSRLKHLSPEQMSWSVMQATGFLDGQRAAGVAEADKKLPIDPKKPDDPVRLAEREKQIEAFTYGKVKGNLGTFVKLFGHAAGQAQTDFFATVDQALFFSNGGTVLSWLNPSGNNLTARLNKLEDPGAIAEEMYISVLTRRPSEQEAKDVTEYLASRKDDRVGAVKEMAWALVTSAEFRFSH